MLEIAVITISDRAFRGEYDDKSGPRIVEIISDSDVEANIATVIVPDEEEQIRAALLDNIGKDYIFTTGGTGISPRDVTPGVTAEVCDKELPGISELMRRESYRETRNAVFSRAYSGVKDLTIIINFPGSLRAVNLCTNLMLPILEHGKKMLLGGKH